MDQQWQLDANTVRQIHEKFAFSLHQKGDFEGAVTHYIAAGSHPASVIAMFADLIPQALVTSLTAAPPSSAMAAATATTALHIHPTAVNLGLACVGAPLGPLPRLSGVILNRAASALVTFCEHHRSSVSAAANSIVEARQLASSSANPAPGAIVTSGGAAATSAAQPVDGGSSDPDERIRVSVLVDTVLLAAHMACNPPRKQAVVELVSSQNRCHIESCSVILASHGNAFIEALLWLYRSHGEHKRVLSQLNEDRCGGVGGWTKEQLYMWTADYLRWLWAQGDASSIALVLQNVRPVLEFDAELGVSVFMAAARPTATSSAGAAGVPFADVSNTIPNSHLSAIMPLIVHSNINCSRLYRC